MANGKQRQGLTDTLQREFLEQSLKVKESTTAVGSCRTIFSQHESKALPSDTAIAKLDILEAASASKSFEGRPAHGAVRGEALWPGTICS